jgi:hypothetical protein
MIGITPKITIGILGCSAGTGVTHLAIALSNYLASDLGKKTALIEMGQQYALSGLAPMGVGEGFAVGDVHYFPHVEFHKMGHIMNQNYQYLILDLGKDSNEARAEWLRCDGKIIVGSLSPWRKNVFYDVTKRIVHTLGDTGKCTFLSLFGDRVDNKKYSRAMRVPIKSIPYIADPFQPEKEVKTFLQTIVSQGKAMF